jgi:hypothetical protein
MSASGTAPVAIMMPWVRTNMVCLSHLVMKNNMMELTVCREAEKNVNNICAQFNALFPVFS